MPDVTDQTLSLSNLVRPEIQADPYPFYHHLRHVDPVHWDSPRGYPAGWWVVTRYDDVSAALQDERMSSRRFPDLDKVPTRVRPIARALMQQLLYTDPPTHTRLRALVNKAFTPRMIESLRPRVQHIADELLDAVQGNGEMDAVRDFALPLPVSVIAELLGVAVDDRRKFADWGEDLGAIVGNTRPSAAQAAQAAQSLEMLTQYFQAVVMQRRIEPRDDLLQRLITAEENNNVLTEDELYANCILLLLAGHETTTSFISNALLALLMNPDQIEALRHDSALWTTAIPELLRYDSPVQVAQRIAAQDLELGGRDIKAGQQVLLLLGAANRDPAQFAEPDRLDLSRKENRHMAFAQGVHYCLGAALARLESEIALSTVLRRFPMIRPATDALEWDKNLTFRALKRQPVLFTA